VDYIVIIVNLKLQFLLEMTIGESIEFWLG